MRITKSTTAKLVGSAAVVFALCTNAMIAGAAQTNATKNMDNVQSGFNVLTSTGNIFQTAEIMEMVWPGVYITNNHANFVLNTDMMTSITSSVVAGHQRTVYVIKPGAKWSDGVSITADDFIYNWQAQSGNAAYQDCPSNHAYTCEAFDDASTTGYASIISVVGSHPAVGACQLGSSVLHTLHLCPNGKTVTVTYGSTTPFADWQGLFGLLIPAHQARVIGFNKGYNFTSACSSCGMVSGAWYNFHSFDGSNTVVLSKNTNYYGPAATLATLTFLDYPDDSTGVTDLENGTLDVFEPNGASAAQVSQAEGYSSPVIGISNIPAFTFEHIDFNVATPGLNNLNVRKAIALGTNRQEIIDSTDGLIQPSLRPLGNHMLFPSEVGYTNNGSTYTGPTAANVTAAKHDLGLAGYHMGSDGYFQTTGTGNQHDVTFTISSTTAPRRAIEMQIFQGNMAHIGIKIHTNPTSSWFSTTYLYSGSFQIGLFAWVGSNLLTPNQPIYCSNPLLSMTNSGNPNCGSDYDHINNPTLDTQLKTAVKQVNPTTERADFNIADKTIWAQMYTLPLYQRLSSVFWRGNYHNVTANPTQAGVLWDANKWSGT